MTLNKFSKRKSLALILSLSVCIFSCSTDNPVSTVNQKDYKLSSFKNKSIILGKVDFSTNKRFNTKATLDAVGSRATVSLIYTSDHTTQANETIATGLTDDYGNFSLSITNNFSPIINDIFLLEARKRVGSAGNAMMTIRTYIKWTESGWQSISYPQDAGVIINSKTTAITIMKDLNSSISANDCLNKINVGSTPSTSNNIGAITSTEIDKIAEVVKSIIGKNEDPTRYIRFINGKYSVSASVNPSMSILTSTKYCPSCNFINENLTGLNLSGAELSNANFTNTNLTNVDLSNSNLSDANFTGTNFANTNLSNAIWNDTSICSSSTNTDCNSEFQVNSLTLDAQRNPAIASDSSGNFVVTWFGSGFGDGVGIHAQRYNSQGIAQGAEISVNSFTTSNQLSPAIAMDASGNFVIAWYGQGSGDSIGIFARRFDSNGTPLANEFRANSYTTGFQLNPSVAVDNVGNFVITWQSQAQDGNSYGVYAQRYNSSGVSQGIEFRVNTVTSGNQSNPYVSMSNSGNFVIAWSGAGSTDTYGVYAKRYNSSGTLQGQEFLVNTNTTDIQTNPAIATDSSGNFVITWYGRNNLDPIGITAQRFNSSGVSQGSEIVVNTKTTGNQIVPSISMDSLGDFVISWHGSYGDADGDSVSIQRFNNKGIAQRFETLSNTYQTSNQQFSSVAMDSIGNFVVTWHSNAQDGSENGIYAKRYKFAEKDVTILASGLKYKVIKEGTGKTPLLSDSVSTNYRGTLVNGNEFESSNGLPITFQVTSVIDGWKEALQLMKEGDKWELYIPSNLAYGAAGSPPKIAPNSDLIFELELVHVN